MKVYKSEAGGQAIYESYERLVSKWGVETKEHDLETSYGTTHVITAGSDANPPLLMFHGAGDNSALMWIKNAEALARDFRVIAIDTLGGSGKSVPNERYRKEFNLVTWYGDILSAMDIKKAYVTGVSYGAYHCQLIMISFPERIEKMVAIAGYISATGYDTSQFAVMMRMMKFFLPVAFFPTKATTMRAAARLCGPGADELMSDEEISNHFRLVTRQYRTQAQFNHKRKTFSAEEVDSIRDKSLFLMGEKDEVVNFAGAERAMQDFKLNRKIIPNAGHAVNQTRPREIEAALRSFFLGS